MKNSIIAAVTATAILLASLLATTASAGENTFNIYFKGDVRDHFLTQKKTNMTRARLDFWLKHNVGPNTYAVDQNASGKYGGWHVPLTGNGGYTPARNAWGFSISSPATGTNKSYAQQKK